MLKFKEMKKNIMQPREKHVSPMLDSKKCGELTTQLSFKSIKQHHECSPLARNQQAGVHQGKYDTEVKKTVSAFTEFEFKSDSKENNAKHLYYNRGATFGELSAKKLDFGAPKRKINHIETVECYDKSYENSASKTSNLSFATLLQSKKPL